MHKRKQIRFLGIKLCMLAVLLCNAAQTRAQECEPELDPKAEKLLDKANDKKKYKSAQRKQFMIDALELDENCLECMYQLGKKAYRRAKNSDLDFTAAKSYLKPLVEACPEYHAEPYYFLGAMAYADQEYTDAQEFFDKYIHFSGDDPKKLGRDYDDKYETVKAALPSIAFFKKYAENPVDYNPIKVAEISTKEGEEYLPMLSPDNESIFFTKKYMKKTKFDITGKYVEEFTVSSRENVNQAFGECKALEPPFNIGRSYGGATLSVNNKEMYIAVSNPNGTNPDNIDIFKSTYRKVIDEQLGEEKYKWSDLESIGDHINTKGGWEAQPSLSSDGQLLFFASARPESVKGPDGNPSVDIYYCERQENGSWGDPINLQAINTLGSDKTPFMHTDSRTLYFSSNAHRGFGGFDLFYTRQNDDGTWGEPENLGAPINTHEDQEGLIVATDGKLAYFSSRLEGEASKDIYAFEMPERAKPQKVMMVKGMVKDNADKVVEDLEIEIHSNSRETPQKIEVDAEDGSYAAIVNIEKPEDVVVLMKKEGYAFSAQSLVTKNETVRPSAVKLETTIEKVSVNKPFEIQDVNYDTSSSDISQDSKLILDLFASYMKSNPTMKIEIRGHTDNRGNDADNLALSTDRAFEVLGYLQMKGIESSRLTYKGFGSSKPIATNSTEEGRLKNRRTEFVIMKM